MAIPAQFLSDLAAFQKQVAAAAPILSAPQATVSAIQLNMDNLIDEATGALGAGAGNLDNWTAPQVPVAIAAAVLGIVSSAADQWNLTDIIALLGRVNLNLDEVSPGSLVFGH